MKGNFSFQKRLSFYSYFKSHRDEISRIHEFHLEANPLISTLDSLLINIKNSLYLICLIKLTSFIKKLFTSLTSWD